MLFSFDLDGVLQENPFATGVFPEVSRLIGPYVAKQCNISSSDAERMVPKLIFALARLRIEQGDFVAGYDWDGIVQQVAAEAGYPKPEAISVEGLVRKYCQPEHIKLHDHAEYALQFLVDQGVELFVLTNGFDVYQLPVLQQLGVSSYFQERFSPEKVGAIKPQEAMFRAVQAAAPGTRLAVHVGDSLVQDIFGARRAGFTAVWVERCLPADMRALSPWERAIEANWADVGRLGLERNARNEPFPLPSLAECRPDYIVAHLGEIPWVYEHLVESRAMAG